MSIHINWPKLNNKLKAWISRIFLFQCHDTTVQFITFLSNAFSNDELQKRVPDVAQLLSVYNIPADVTFALIRIATNQQISAKWEELKKIDRKDKEKQTTAAKVIVFSMNNEPNCNTK